MPVPDTFELHIELDGTWVKCELVWIRGDDVGVRFTSPIERGTARRTQAVTPEDVKKKVSLRREPRSPPKTDR